jgi:hypothetical protein
MQFLGSLYVAAAGRLGVDSSISVEKDSAWML